jgi:indole-3-glycerol phosphate synthase
MASPLLWLEALAGLKALYDLVEGSVDFVTSYQKHRLEADTIAEANRASTTYSTYSDRELEELGRKQRDAATALSLRGAALIGHVVMQYLQRDY